VNLTEIRFIEAIASICRIKQENAIVKMEESYLGLLEQKHPYLTFVVDS